MQHNKIHRQPDIKNRYLLGTFCVRPGATTGLLNSMSFINMIVGKIQNLMRRQFVDSAYSNENEWIYSHDRKIRQPVKQEHQGTITACAYRCPESTIIQLRGTIDCVVKTQHYETKSCLAIKRTKTYTLNVTQRREKTLNSRHMTN